MRWCVLAIALMTAAGCVKFTDEHSHSATRSTTVRRQQPLPVIRLKGSDAMQDLVTDLAAEYRNARVVAEGGGTASGFDALAANTADVAVASSRMPSETWLHVERKRQAHIIETPIAYDVVALYVNSANPVTQLTTSQVAEIMRGSISNWKKAGGPNAPIHIYGESSTSGFTTYLDAGDRPPKTRRTFADARGTIRAVAEDADAIAFAHPVQTQQAHVLSIARESGGAAAAPSNAAVLDGTYPLADEVFFYTFDTSPVTVKKFLAWARSAAAAKAFTSTGFTQMRK